MQRVVERMADMEAAGDVGRRVHDREGFRIRAIRAERACLFPMGIPARFNSGRIKSSGQCGGHFSCFVCLKLRATRSLHPSTRSLPGYHPGGRVEGAGGLGRLNQTFPCQRARLGATMQ